MTIETEALEKIKRVRLLLRYSEIHGTLRKARTKLAATVSPRAQEPYKAAITKIEAELDAFVREHQYDAATEPVAGPKLVGYQRRLGDLALKHPEEAAVTEALGGEIPRRKGLIRIRKYRVIGGPVVLGQPRFVDLQRRLADQAYNEMLDESHAVKQAVLDLAGPVLSRYWQLKRELDMAYRDQGQIKADIYRATHRTSRTSLEDKLAVSEAEANSAALVAVKERIVSLTSEISVLKGRYTLKAAAKKAKSSDPILDEITLFDEHRMLRQNPEYLKLVSESKVNGSRSTIEEIINQAAGRYKPSYGGQLYGVTFDSTADDFRVAFHKMIEDIDAPFHELKPRHGYRKPVLNGDGTIKDWQMLHPENIVTWQGYPGSGAPIVARLPHTTERQQQMASVYDGSNTMFKLLPATQADIDALGRGKRIRLGAEPHLEHRTRDNGITPIRLIDHTKRNEKLFIAYLRVGTNEDNEPIYAVSLVVYHDILPPDTIAPEVAYVSERRGGKTLDYLTITYEIPRAPASTSTAVGELTIDLDLPGDAFAKFRRDDNVAFGAWFSRTETNAQRWIKKDGDHYLLGTIYSLVGPPQNPTELVPIVSGIPKRLIPTIESAKKLREDHYYHIGEYAKLARRSLAQLVKDGVPLPAWYREEGIHFMTSKGLLRAFRRWIHHLRETPEIDSQLGRIMSTVRRMWRERGEAIKNREMIEDERYQIWLDIASDLAPIVSKELPMSIQQALFFVVLVMFEERNRHLGEWATNVERSALAYRLSAYRQFAKWAVTGLGEIRVNTDYLRKRYKSDKQKYVAPADLISAIESQCVKQGVTFTIATETHKKQGRKTSQSAQIGDAVVQ